MKIYFTLEASSEVLKKFDSLHFLDDDILSFFEKKFYSEYLHVLYIGVSCFNAATEAFFILRRPKYTSHDRKYVYKGVELFKEAKTFEYELRLDFLKYAAQSDIRESLAKDIIKSLDTISACKKIKDLDIEKFKVDMAGFFSNNKWL